VIGHEPVPSTGQFVAKITQFPSPTNTNRRVAMPAQR